MKKLLTNAWILLLLCVGIYLLYEYLGSSYERKHQHTIIAIQDSANRIIFHLDNGKKYLIGQETVNERNVLLFYEGKLVRAVECSHPIWKAEKKGCWEITPVEQNEMPLLTDEQYELLIKRGFTDSDLRYSYRIPPEHPNPNREPFSYFGLLSFGAPGVEAQELP
jgi:hypothetical protein